MNNNLEKNKNEILSFKKLKREKIFKWSTISISSLMGLILIALIIFILIYAIQGFKDFGIMNILFTSDFNNESKSFWIPFAVTLITSLLALIVSVPLGVKVAIFIKYRIKEKWRKKLIIFFQTLSGIPSVIFGLFAVNSLGVLLETLFSISKNSIFTASIMLVFMVLPTIISLTTESLDAVDKTMLSSSLALGNSNTISIYKITKKIARNGIIVAIIIALSRSIGESMAVSLILQSTPNSNEGFFDIFSSSGQTLGAYIATSMFADSDPDKIRPLLYAFGFIMLIISMLLNIFVSMILFKKKSGKKVQQYLVKIVDIVYFVPNLIKNKIEKVFFKTKYKLERDNLSNLANYIKDRTENYRFKNAYSVYKVFWEIFAIVICSGFLLWITGDIIINGLISISNEGGSFIAVGKNTLSQSLLNTFIVIVVTISIGFPLSLMIAIYLNEYSRNKKLKMIITFFLDTLGSTPSILYGMFGLLFFIETLGLSSTGSTGNSLIAGSLTLVIVIIPSFTRLIEQNIKNIPNEIRLNSYALGNSKFETIRKLIIPNALGTMSSSIVATIGRILSETAPLYLTAGLSSSVSSSLTTPGTTLTTYIYAQIYSTEQNALDLQYQGAIVTMMFVLVLMTIAYWIIPNWRNIIMHLSLLKESVFGRNNNKNEIIGGNNV